MKSDDFPMDPKQFEAAELHWERLVSRIANSFQPPQHWVRWIPQEFANGTPIERDGNPIYDAWERDLDRAIRIIQHAGSDESLQVAAWLNHWDEQYSELPRDELVFSLVYSDEASSLLEQLLRLWMAPVLKKEEIMAFIRERVASANRER